MYYSNNTIMRSCFNHAIVNVNSCIGAKLAFYGLLALIFSSISYVMRLSMFHKVKLLIMISLFAHIEKCFDSTTIHLN